MSVQVFEGDGVPYHKMPWEAGKERLIALAGLWSVMGSFDNQEDDRIEAAELSRAMQDYEYYPSTARIVLYNDYRMFLRKLHKRQEMEHKKMEELRDDLEALELHAQEQVP